jgi:DNA-binding response OmpR family regulator
VSPASERPSVLHFRRLKRNYHSFYGADMNERILVVDDEESLRLSLKFKLKSAGFDVDVATDGEDAVEKLKTKQADVVLLDINMPRMSGIEALNYIRQTYPKTEVIMLTGFADFSTAIECLKMGARDYLVKPVDTTELVTRVRSLMRSRSSERALQQVQEKYSSVVVNDLIAPLHKIQGMLDQATKLTSDGDAKERKKLLTNARELTGKMEQKLQQLMELTKEAAKSVVAAESEIDPIALAEQLKSIQGDQE